MSWINDFQQQYAKIETLHDALVLPLTELIPAERKFNGGVYDNSGKLCQRAAHVKNGYKNEMSAVLETKPDSQLVSGKYIYGGMLQNGHFGHFLVESLSRLWACKRIKNAKGVIFILRDIKKKPAKFVITILELLLDDMDIICVTSPLQVETLLVPDQMAHPRSGYIQGHQIHNPLLNKLRIVDKNMPKKVYVSRAGLKSNEGRFLGETVLHENLHREGYHIIHPQELSIEEQLRIYTNAEKLIFADGSAFHLYILVANSAQTTFIVWRRKNHSDFTNQSLTFAGKKPAGKPCLTGYYTESDRKHSPTIHKAVLDFESLKTQLVEADFITGELWAEPTKHHIDEEVALLSKRFKREFKWVKSDSEGVAQEQKERAEP